jgi:hypothetical protein
MSKQILPREGWRDLLTEEQHFATEWKPCAVSHEATSLT